MWEGPRELQTDAQTVEERVTKMEKQEKKKKDSHEELKQKMYCLSDEMILVTQGLEKPWSLPKVPSLKKVSGPPGPTSLKRYFDK